MSMQHEAECERCHSSPCPEREIWPFLKGSHISDTGGVMPTKTGVHAPDIDP